MPAHLARSAKAKGKQRQVDEDSVSKSKKRQAAHEEPESEPESESGSGESSSSDEEGEPEAEEEEGPTLDLDKIRKKTHYALRQLSAAAKRARTFEIQKLIKRIKAAPATEKDSLEAQLAALKSADLPSIAAASLLGKLGKAKLLPRGPSSREYKTPEAQAGSKGVDEWPVMAGVWAEKGLAAAWVESAAPSSAPDGEDKAKAAVKAKLLSSKLLAEVCNTMVDALARLAGKERAAPARQADAKEEGEGKKVDPAKSGAKSGSHEDASEEREWSGSEDDGEDGKDDSEGAGSSEEEDDDDDDDAQLDEAGIQARVDALGDLDQWDELMAGPSDADDGDNAGDDDDEQSADEAEDARASLKKVKAMVGKRKREPSPARKTQKKAKQERAESAASSDGDDDDDEEDEDDEDDSQAGSQSDSEGASDSDSDSDSDSASSHFLPSLSHGFLPHALRTKDDEFSGSEGSDSGSDIEDDAEDKAARAKGGAKKKERKNRMGQRARKALWEKKYGRNANHLKLLQKEKKPSSSSASQPRRDAGTEGNPQPQPYKPLRRGRNGQPLPEFEVPAQRDAGWKKFPVPSAAAPAPAPAPAPARERGATARERFARTAKPGAGAGAGSGAVPPPWKAKERPAVVPRVQAEPEAEMHPSWVAKQKQKEREEMVARALAGQGGAKKVVFD